MTAAVIPLRDWRSSLLYTEGKLRHIRHVQANAIVILANDTSWSGKIRYNTFARGIVAADPPWDACDEPSTIMLAGDRSGAWRETDATRLAAWLARHYELILSPAQCYGAAEVVAERAAYDPVSEWFDSLRWDGVRRLDRWCSNYLGAVDTPYVRFAGRLFLVSVVARVFKPGCKVDTMLVLEGPQGEYKSTAIRALVGDEWFSDTPLELGSKDRFVGLRGVLVHEFAELDTLGKADVARVKNFLSSPRDDFRPPYGHTNVRVPRRCVFVGTVNPEGGGGLGYFRDPTGFRRALPVAVGGVRLRDLEADREQLWAEAVEIYRGTREVLCPLADGLPDPGKRWYPETAHERALCGVEQEARTVQDPWQGAIAGWLETRLPHASVSLSEVLSDVCGIELGKQDRAHQTRAGNCVGAAGWVCTGRGPRPRRERVYTRPPPVIPSTDLPLPA